MSSPIFRNEKLLKVFMWCMCKASHKEHQQLVGRQIVKLMPGQFVTGRIKAANELEFAQSTAWDYLKVLETNGTINIKSDSRYSIITIVNWELYQSNDDFSDSKTNNKSTANQQQINTNKNGNNDENNGTSEIEDLFESLWALYPNKKGKSSIKLSAKKKLLVVGKQALIMAIENYKRHLEQNTWKQPMNGSTFFNGNYVDYIEAETSRINESCSYEPKPNDIEKWE